MVGYSEAIAAMIPATICLNQLSLRWVVKAGCPPISPASLSIFAFPCKGVCYGSDKFTVFVWHIKTAPRERDNADLRWIGIVSSYSLILSQPDSALSNWR